jgi:hypothetical protein
MAPRDDDKAMDGLLRRSLARDAARGAAREINCPEPDILAAYSEQSLDAAETAHYELHFSTCPKCREQLAAIFRTQSVRDVPAEVEMLVHAAGPRSVTSSPVAAAPAATKSAPPRSWTMHLRWLAPVAAVLILVAVVSWQRLARLAHSPASENQVAMTRPESAPKSLTDPSPRQYNVIPPAAPAAELKTQTPEQGRLEADKRPAQLNHQQSGALVAGNRSPSPPNRLQSNTKADLDAAYSQYQQADNLRANDQMQRRVESRRTSDDMGASLEKSAREQTPPSVKALAPAETVNSLDETPKATTSTVEVYSAAQSVAVPAPPPPTPQPKPEAAPAGAPSMTATESVRAGKVSKEKKDAPQAAGGVAAGAVGGTGAGIGGYANSKSAVVDVRSGAAPVIQSQDANVQYRIAGGARIERSDDSGATWQGQRMKAAAQILAGAVPSENVCWLVGRAGAILLTTDGKSWKKISPPADADFVAVTAYDASSAAVTTADGRTFRTTDGGESWQLAK